MRFALSGSSVAWNHANYGGGKRQPSCTVGTKHPAVLRLDRRPLTRLYWALGLLGILSVWLIRERNHWVAVGKQQAALAATDSMRVTLTRQIQSYKDSTKADSVRIAVLSHLQALAIAEATRRGQVASAGQVAASAAILALRDSASEATNARLDTIQAALDSTMAYAGAEKAARVLADSLTGILSQRLASTKQLLTDAGLVVERQAVLLKALKPKTPSPISLGCAVGPTVSAGGFSYAGVSCGLVVRF